MNRNVVRLINRTDKNFDFMFDGVSYRVPKSAPTEEGYLDVTEEAGRHGKKKSIMLYDLETGRGIYQVGIEGVDPIDYIGKGKLAEEEVIDRESDIEGTPTKVDVRGGRASALRENDALAE